MFHFVILLQLKGNNCLRKNILKDNIDCALKYGPAGKNKSLCMAKQIYIKMLF